MDTFSKLRPPDAVRIKAKIVERNDNNSSSALLTSSLKYREPRKFCVDPQLTSYDVLYSIIAQAFGLNDEFQMSYLNRENHAINENTSNLNEDLTKCDYLTISNDWDLDAAFLYSSYPYLSLNIIVSSDELFKFDEEQQSKQVDLSLNDDWDVISNLDLKPTLSPLALKNNSSKINTSSKRHSLNIESNSNMTNLDTSGRSLIALWSNSAADKAVSVFQKMIHPFSRSNSHTSNLSNLTRISSTSSFEKSKLMNTPKSMTTTKTSTTINAFDLFKMEKLKQPIGDSEYKNFLDSDGRIIILADLKQRIFDGGCEPSRRKELWPILLDVYPVNQQPMTAQQRTDYIKFKSAEYINLKGSLWFNQNKNLLKKKSHSLPDTELNILANKIQKDVWRTDRCHRFYSGDSNKNVESLFNILMTYTLANGGFYAQGMSDLLSPLLYVLRDEPLAFICFTALMKRCASNFDINSDSICSKIEVLAWLVNKYDPVFWQYLRQQGADQLLFVYRWLFIDCKREFPFNDSLRMFEIMWSTIESTSLTTSTHDQFNASENFFSNFYSRSSSNASSLNLRLFKNYLNRQSALSSQILGDGSSSSAYVDDELISDVEYQNSGIETYSQTSDTKQSKNNSSTPEKQSLIETNKTNLLCEYCRAEKSMLNLKLKKDELTNSSNSYPNNSTSESELSTSSDSSLDEDQLEALAKKRNRSKWKQNSRLSCGRNQSRINMRPRYLSLNIFNEDSCKEVIVSQHSNSKLNQNKENCLSDIQNKLSIHLDLNKNNESKIGISSSSRSLSTSCLECLNLCTSNLRNGVGVCISNRNICPDMTTHTKSIKIKKRKTKTQQHVNTAIPIIKASKAFSLTASQCNAGVSSPAKFSTSETGTLKHSQTNIFNMSSSNHLSSHEVKEQTSSDIDQQTTKLQFKPKQKKKFKKSSSSKLNENLLIMNRSDLHNKKRNTNHHQSTNKCTCNNNNSSSFIDSNDDFSNKLKQNDKQNDEIKNITTASSSGIGGSSTSSSDSSKCSTPYPQTNNNKLNLLNINTNTSAIKPTTKSNSTTTAMKTTASKQHNINNSKTNSFDDDEEEELIYSISKLDNPFLLFICFALFIEHRDHIMNSHMDANDIACYFDKLTRKHNLKNILSRARYLYTKIYLSKTNVFNYLQQLNEIPLNSP